METEINSILNSVKKKLGLDPEEVTEFDPDILDAINMTFGTLTQLGIGPIEGFEIHGSEETWDQFIDDPRKNMVRSYVYVKTKLLFDPPQSSYAVTAMQDQAKEYEWRLNLLIESPKSFPTS